MIYASAAELHQDCSADDILDMFFLKDTTNTLIAYIKNNERKKKRFSSLEMLIVSLSY